MQAIFIGCFSTSAFWWDILQTSSLDLSGKNFIPCAQEDTVDILFCFFLVILIFDFLDKRIKEALIHLVFKGVFNLMPLSKLIVNNENEKKIRKISEMGKQLDEETAQNVALERETSSWSLLGEYIND